MLPRRYAFTLTVPRRGCWNPCLRFPRQSIRAYATTEGDQTEPGSVAVIGGGITGLASAYYLSQKLPRAHITLYESQKRLGGWLHSEQVQVADGRVILEHGPRTLRSGTSTSVTARLIQELGLVNDVIYTSKSSPAAQNRYLYSPDHLVRMPGPGTSALGLIASLVQEPLLRNAVKAALLEPFQPQRSSDVRDESIASFLTRRFGKSVADDIASAVFHGIYAGDIYQLSARSLLPTQWNWEREHGAVSRGMVQQARQPSITKRDAEFSKKMDRLPLDEDFQTKLAACSVFSFKNGIQQLVDGLSLALQRKSNVVINTGSAITSLSKDPITGKMKVNALGKGADNNDLVVSTITGRNLAAICKADDRTILPTLANMSAVTVMVVNLYYSKPGLLPVKGFGYLLPRTVPFEQNPELALGVIFDSDAIQGQDTVDGTKVTVMLGGHWWDGSTSYPSPEEGIMLARTLLARHLNITETPTLARANLHRDCIPQYTVGHEERLQSTHRLLIDRYGGQLRVAGSSYNGVGVNDCLRAAWEVAEGATGRWDSQKTGLEHLTQEAAQSISSN